MVHRALLLISLVSCTLIFSSFALFTHDQLAGASEREQLAVASPSARMVPAPAKPRPSGQPRRFIDAAAHRLTAPFSAVVHSSSGWVQRGVPTVIALLIYGLGLNTLARYAQGGAAAGRRT